MKEDNEELELLEELDELEDIEDEVLDEPIQDKVEKPKQKSKKQQKKKKSKGKTVAIVVSVVAVVLIGVIVGALFGLGLLGPAGATKSADNVKLKVDMTGISYDGISATHVKTGAELKTALAAKKDVILDNDITLQPDERFEVYSNIYGGGYMVDATAAVKDDGNDWRWEYPIFDLMETSNQVSIQDMYITAYKVKDGEELKLDIDLSYHGLPIVVESGANALVKHCVIENSHRGIYVKAGAKVTIEGCIIRNNVDACISLETSSKGPSNITLKNNVLMNACVAGVLVWGYYADVTEAHYNKITIEGFLDIYNWKDASDAKLMPATEGSLATMGNKIIAGQITNKKNEKYTYFDSEGKQYFHSGIIIIATGNQSDNDPTVKGFDKIGYTKIKFPLPSAANIAMKVFRLYHYEGENPAIKPGDTINTKTIFDELKNGRK